MIAEATLYVKCMAWLHAVPDKTSKSRAKQLGTGIMDSVEVSRESQVLVSLVTECGLCRADANGINPLAWSDIDAWANCIGGATPWEAKVIRDLSVEYVVELRAATEPSRVFPAYEQDEDAARAAVRAQLKSFIRAKS